MADNNLAALLRDFAQGASNSAATNLSMPVDALAWLLRKGGVNVPPNPVGGSDWLAEKGFTPEPKNKLAGLLGDVAGFAAPLAAVAKAPQIAKGLLQAGENLAKPNVLNSQQGAIVWHGSPHKFPPTPNNPLGEFDFSKIGTGEGAQAYGHGGYLGGAKATGEEYASKLSNPLSGVTYPSEIASNFLQSTNGNKELALDLMEKYKYNAGSHDGERIEKAILWLESNKTMPLPTSSAGYLYKVDLPDEHIAKMLDWDKPLKGKSKKAVDDVVYDYFGGGRTEAIGKKFDEVSKEVSRRSKSSTGSVYNYLADEVGGSPALSESLNKNGVLGIKYLDGGSRAAGAGSSNYVVFPGNERLLKILERNGQKQ